MGGSGLFPLVSVREGLISVSIWWEGLVSAGFGSFQVVSAGFRSFRFLVITGTQNEGGLGGITADGGKLVKTLLQLNGSPAE